MNTPKVEINGTEYELSTKLRVAHKIQGLNAHKPYTEIFQSMDSMPLEKQIEILYAAFEVANPDQSKFITQQRFLDYYLDNFNLVIVMDQMQSVVGGILGKDFSENNDAVPSKEENQGN